jgi:hypothetical protein
MESTLHLVLRLRGGGGTIELTNLATGKKQSITYTNGMTIAKLKENIQN